MFADTLFEEATPWEPLAARIRPETLDEYIGQEHLLSPGQPLYEALEQNLLHSMVLWGPSGVGKTTLARLFARLCDAHFVTLSAVMSGVKDIRQAIDRAKDEQLIRQRKTILFVDEVHRFNKSQQDAFLPHIEDGTIVFMGATTENPSFELNSALLSRARVYVLEPLSPASLKRVIHRALSSEKGFHGQSITIEPEAETALIQYGDGDARRVLNLLETAVELSREGFISTEVITSAAAGSGRRFDKGGDHFYDQLSAFHKSVRGSSPDAALYWAARMIDGGADPYTLLRRLVAIASEDIGNADPRALEITVNAWQAFERLGSPEGYLSLAQATAYCACAPKSNAVYLAWKRAMADVQQSSSCEVPRHLRNAPTELMKQMGNGRNYRYPHDEPNGFAAGECYLPEELGERKYYQPNPRGLEIKIGNKLTTLALWNDQASGQQ